MGPPPPRLPVRTGQPGVFAFYFKELDAAPSGGLAAPCHPPRRPPLRPRVASPAGWWPRGEARPWVPISSPSPYSAPSSRTLSQPGGICVVQAQAVVPRASVSPVQHPWGGRRGCPSSRDLLGTREQRGPRPAHGPTLAGVSGGLSGGAVVGTSPILPPGGCLVGGLLLCREARRCEGDNVTGVGTCLQRDPLLGGDGTAGDAAGEKGREKSRERLGARRGWGQGRGQEVMPPLPGVATAAPSRRRGAGSALLALCPAFLALFSFFSSSSSTPGRALKPLHLWPGAQRCWFRGEAAGEGWRCPWATEESPGQGEMTPKRLRMTKRPDSFKSLILKINK
ncbi:uncharacterized protein LOC121078649 [Cygnus olor]|uniref:uncharacterized protein LOC121078649 n=1 Tax=Cygnus olor TaxID=8869 RepID=UPI001ADE9675|nr:uncharacterized protein LOC121078649 [Cygnus olor]